MNKLKIAFYYPNFYFGGTEIAIARLAKKLYKDYDIYFLYRGMHDLDIAAELRKYGIPMNVRQYSYENRFICDILVFCSIVLETDNLLQCVKAKKRILWSHAMIPKGGGTKMYNLPFMRTIDDVVSVSHAADDSIPKWMYMGKRIPDFHVIHNILDTELIKRNAELPSAKPIQLAKDLNICTVARIGREKGWHRVKIFCDELVKQGIDFKWFIIGEGYYDDQVNHAHSLLDKFPQVEFLGKMENPFPIVKEMDYVALLSDFESWGLVITEGKILGVPALITDFPAGKEQITDGENGFIVPMMNLSKYKDIVPLLLEKRQILKDNLHDFDFEIENIQSVNQWKELFRIGVDNNDKN